MRVLVTGANGFVGSFLCPYLQEQGVEVLGAVRSAARPVAPGVVSCVAGDVGPDTEWGPCLQGIEAVVHLASHPGGGGREVDAELYRRVNVEGAGRLATQAAAAGVRRLLYLSTIKVHGEASGAWPFAVDGELAPEDAYARSKRDAEVSLQDICQRTGLELCIVRPPLIYGPGVRGNFAFLLRMVARGVPLPLGSIRNRRSLASLWNVAGLVARCLERPEGAGGVFLVSDGEDLSTPDLVRRMGHALHREARLLPVPPAVLTLCARLAGREGMVRRLTGSLQVDIAPTCEALDWHPPLGLDEGLRRTATWYLSARP